MLSSSRHHTLDPHLTERQTDMQAVFAVLLLAGVGLIHAGPLPPEPLLQTQENFDLDRVRTSIRHQNTQQRIKIKACKNQ